MEPPGSYCAYACLYITLCLLKIFTLATNTFEEQFQHINGLQKISINLLQRTNNNTNSMNEELSYSTNYETNDSNLGLNMDDNDNFYEDIKPYSYKNANNSINTNNRKFSY